MMMASVINLKDILYALTGQTNPKLDIPVSKAVIDCARQARAVCSSLSRVSTLMGMIMYKLPSTTVQNRIG